MSIRKKITPCYGEIELDIMYNQGIIRIGEVFDLGLQLGLIQHRESAFTVDHRNLGPDRAAATAALERLGLASELEQVIRHKLLRNDRLDR
jgi:recombination protein RecA